jgi:hypothetical protein
MGLGPKISINPLTRVAEFLFSFEAGKKKYDVIFSKFSAMGKVFRKG